MADQLSQCGAMNHCDNSNGFGFGDECNRCFFETLLMLIIIVWLLRWLFSCAC